MELISKLTVTGAANIDIGFNPYTFYTNNNNYMKIEFAHDFIINNGYLFFCPTVWFSCESTIWGRGFNFAGTTGIAPNFLDTNGVTAPLTITFNNGTAVSVQDGYTTQTQTYTGNMPNDTVVFYHTSNSGNYSGEFYGLKIYGAGDVLAHHYVGFDDGVDVGIMDLVTEQKYTPTGSGYTIQCEEYTPPTPTADSKIYLGSLNLGTGKIRLGANDVSAIYLGASLLYPPSGPTPPTPSPTNVDYIHTSSTTSRGNFISTGIYPTTDTYFRIVYKPNELIGSTVVGFDENTTPTNCSSDNDDYRYFYHRGLDDVTLDFNSSREYATITFDADGYADITCGNNYINDNLTHTTTVGELQVTITQGVPIYLNVSSDLDFRSLEIWQNNVKVYDAHAAELNGTYGIYESIGDTFISQTYGGNSMSGGSIQRDYLCFTATTAPASFVLSTHNITPTIYYSTDNGNNWTQWDYSAITLQNVGDKVYFYGNNPNGLSNANGGYCHFSQTAGNVGRIAASGDIMSLIDYTCPKTIPNNGCFYGLFDRFIQLTTAPKLGATTLTESCYAYMFNGCTNLTTAPELPVTTVPAYAYQQMFQGCTSLTTAPDLPATNLGNSSYEMMFLSCTSLTTAPVLPAKTIPTYAYDRMFQYCSNLNSVTCLATDISASMCTNIWLYDVAQSGTFTKDSSMSSWTTGTSGIPSGWTVEDYYDCTDCDNWQECGYESYEDCNCQQYGEDCIDCSDCSNWEDCGFESQADCDCQDWSNDYNSYEECMCTAGELTYCESTDCTDWENLGYESYEDCDCAENGNCDEPEDPCMDVDCADCNNWDNECCAGMYESYEECDCHMNGNNCPEEEEPEP